MKRLRVVYNNAYRVPDHARHTGPNLPVCYIGLSLGL